MILFSFLLTIGMQVMAMPYGHSSNSKVSGFSNIFETVHKCNKFRQCNSIYPSIPLTWNDDCRCRRYYLIRFRNMSLNSREYQEARILEAIVDDELDFVQDCVDRGFDINSKLANNRSVLYEAARLGRAEIVNYLLMKGSVIGEPCVNGETALYTAIANDKYEVIKCLFEFCDKNLDKNIWLNVEGKRFDGDTVLHVAAEKGNLYAVKNLLDKGADINSRTVSGYTPLNLAVIYGRDKIVQYLIQRGAKAGIGDLNGDTPLHNAVLCGNMNMIRSLFGEQQGTKVKNVANLHVANVNQRNNNGVSPLMLAKDNDLVSIEKYLLDKGAFFKKKKVRSISIESIKCSMRYKYCNIANLR